VVVAGLGIWIFWGPGTAKAQIAAGADSGFATFQLKCFTCHGKADMPQAPSPAALRELPPERLYAKLTAAAPDPHASLGLNDDQKRKAAEAIAYRLIGSAESGEAAKMPNRCAGNPPMPDPASEPGWNGWGNDSSNTRFQSAKDAGLTGDQVPKLKLKWAFGFPGGASAYGQPTVVSGRVFVGADTGHIYSLDAKTGCVYWSFLTKAGTRNAMTIGPVKGHPGVKYGVFFGDLKSNVYGIDAQTGKMLWISKADDNLASRITAAPALHDGRLFVGTSRWEANAARDLNYPCCTVRGAVIAYDASTGRQIWKHATFEEPLRKLKTNSIGTQLWGPAGGMVWNTPTVDPKRNAIYFGTGDSTTDPAPRTSDSVLALDMKTGKMLWFHQAVENDSYLLGCMGSTKTENCPEHVGPDTDIGASPILKTLPGGKRLLIAGVKNGMVFAMDPDKNGDVVWKVNLTPGGISGVVWGGSADEKFSYWGLSSGGVAAVQHTTGEKAWFNPLTPPAGRGRAANQAATTTIPGAVFAGGKDGILRALSTADGSKLWEFDTVRDFETINKVPAHGGSMIAPGATVAGGMVFVGSGYSVFGDNPGNVILAFSAE
jgi:polyvinyl alcohol dehydrogenase (cytochrome)